MLRSRATLPVALALVACASLPQPSRAETLSWHFSAGPLLSRLREALPGGAAAASAPAAPRPAPAATALARPAAGAGFAVEPGVWSSGASCANVGAATVFAAIPAGTPIAQAEQALRSAVQTELAGQFGQVDGQPDPVCHSAVSIRGASASLRGHCTQGRRQRSLDLTLTMAGDGQAGVLIDHAMHDRRYPLHRTGPLPAAIPGTSLYGNSCVADLLSLAGS